MSLFKNKFIAHRGLHQNRVIPENSLLAFKKAKDKNYAIEFDLTITKDSQIIVFHDDDLIRLCNLDKKVEDENYAFLKELKLYDTKENIPLFKDVLTLIDGMIPLIIEIKKHKNIGILENIVVDSLLKYKGEYFICSFEKDILIWFKKNKSDFKRGLIFGYSSKKFERYKYLLFLYKYFKTKPDFISLEVSLLKSSFFYFCRKKSLEVITWTIKDEKRFKQIEKKVNGVIFEGFII